MITIKFPNNTLQVEEAKLQQIPFFKAMLNFEKTDTLEVDLPYEYVKVILDNNTYQFNTLSDYLGSPLLMMDNRKIVKQHIIYKHNTYEEFIESNDDHIQCLKLGGNIFCFNEDLTKWNAKYKIISADDLLVNLLIRTSNAPKMGFYQDSSKFFIDKIMNLDKLREQLTNKLKLQDVKYILEFIDEFQQRTRFSDKIRESKLLRYGRLDSDNLKEIYSLVDDVVSYFTIHT